MNSIVPRFTAGIDVGDRQSHLCVLDADGNVERRDEFPTSRAGVSGAFEDFDGEPIRVVLEVGTHSPWMHEVLVDLGHEVIVANARELALIAQNDKKNDRNDAELLARLGRVDPKLLAPIWHRPKEHRKALALLRTRDALVRSRTILINNVRALVKTNGGRLPKFSSEAFAKKTKELLPKDLLKIAKGVLRSISSATEEIRKYDKEIARLAKKKFPETGVLQQVHGVGPVTALAFRLTISDPKRFKKSRTVGPYLGLTRRQQQSGHDPELRISKCGDGFVRKLLVGSSHCILRGGAPDSDLRRWGKAIYARGGRNAKKRAVVAVARKLAVLLHRLWVTGEVYEPLRNTARTTPVTRN
jgi:transposase